MISDWLNWVTFFRFALVSGTFAFFVLIYWASNNRDKWQ